MKKILFILLAVISFESMAQDTTWVQTFTFDSISTRHAKFDFPQELNDKRFERILMYYKLKCDPQTPWDSYNCGEWDYLAYTRLFEHTGILDSVRVDSSRYVSNWTGFNTMNYDLWTDAKKDTRTVVENYRSGVVSSNVDLSFTNTGTSTKLFNVEAKGSRYQLILTAAELSAAGAVAGPLESITLTIDQMTSGVLMRPVIKMRSTLDTELTSFDKGNFTEVYNLSKTSDFGLLPLVIGENEFKFHSPFNWNGTDNVIIEMLYESSLTPDNSIEFQTETSPLLHAVSFPRKNGVLSFDGTNTALIDLSDIDLGSEITIAFWAKGTGNNGVSTSVLEAVDTSYNRVLNVHMPWSDNILYWDAGAGSSYDRISKSMSANEIDNEWHHWAFVKNGTTGEMSVVKDGVLWHSGTGLNMDLGMMHRIILGANRSIENHWKGKIDDFTIYSKALDAGTIQSWMNKDVDNTHPNFNDILVYFNFDEEEYAIDHSNNDYKLMPSKYGMFDFSEYPNSGVTAANRPLIKVGQSISAGTDESVEVQIAQLKEPQIVFEYTPVNTHFEIVNSFVVLPSGSENIYDISGAVTNSTAFVGGSTFTNEQITFYHEPIEIVNDIEIGRFITPYGINFDLGTNGFTWIYDVTDYVQYLKNSVDLAAHNTQELIDLRFAFIEGVPPRDVHHRQAIWGDWQSFTYANLDDDVSLPAISIPLSDTSSTFKIKSRMTGHGHNGNTNCCEWDSKDHYIKIDGVNRFVWDVWEETACGDNPNPSQGGTWPYAREGWCPGDMVKEYDHEITPFVTPGTNVSIDYDIENVPFNDQAQGAGNYVMAMDLISYSAPNFQHDAAIVEVLNPNNYEYFRKWNPSCQNPRVIIQNTGEQPLTACKIRVFVSWGNWIEYDWTGNLNFLEKEIVEIPVLDYSFWGDYSGESKFTAEIADLGSYQDEYSNNNKRVVDFDAPESVDGKFLVWFTTNNKAHENKWRLEDGEGNIIFERTSLANTTDYKDTFDLAPGCYSVIIEDTDSDGLGYWYSSQVEGETNGNFRLKKVGGQYMEFFPRDFGNYHRYNFSVGFTLGQNELEFDGTIGLYPNPNDGSFFVECLGLTDNNTTLEVRDMMGRVLLTKTMDIGDGFSSSLVELGDIPSGNYFVVVKSDSGVFTKKMIKTK